MEIFFLTIILVGIAFIGLGLNIFFTRKGKFPETEVGQNKHMRELGITCTKCEEMGKWKRAKNKRAVFTIPKEIGVDFTRFSQ